MFDPEKILLNVLDNHADSSKWIDQKFEKIKRLSNTKIGDVGQDFVEALCCELNFKCDFPMNRDQKRARTSPWDIKINGITFELKTATEDVGGNFQFNHVRYHREYEALLCIGISPADIKFDLWSKAEVATNKAGKLVSMDKGSSATYKLTKRYQDLKPIGDFGSHVLKFIKDMETP